MLKMSVNVLCLHGCNQTETMFRDLMKNFIKLGEKQYGIKFHFTEAKYDHPLGGKTWYKVPLHVPDIGTIAYSEDLVKDTMDDIRELIHKNNITVLLGFSQGANVVDTYLAYFNNDNLIKRAVILSGYSLVDNNRNPSINVSVLGVVSDSDTVVSSNLNPTGYKTSQVIKHDKGHKLPTSNTTIRQILTFMNA